MRFRTILAGVGTTAVLALGVPMAASASPQAAAHPGTAATIYPADEVRTGCWSPDTIAGWGWNGSGQFFNDDTYNCYGGDGDYRFVLTPCPYQGYCSMTEVYVDIAGIWQSTGNCAGFSYALDRIVKQRCNGATYQQFAGVIQPDGSHLIWNRWLEDNYPHVCPIAGGYTQQVITSNSTNGAVYLSCPQGAGGQSYTGAQSWYLIEPIL